MSTIAYYGDNFIDCTYSYYTRSKPVLFNAEKLPQVDKIVINGQLYEKSYICPTLSLNTGDIFSVQIYLTNDEPLLQLSEFFSDCNRLVSVDFSHVTTQSLGSSLEKIFANCSMLQQVTWGESINWEQYTDFTQAFYYCGSIEEISLPGHALKYFDEAFRGCFYLKKVSGYIDHFESAQYMFANIQKSTKLDIDIKSYQHLYDVDVHFNTEWNPRSAKGMFSSCYCLEQINFINLDTNHLFTSYERMFELCKALKSIDMSVFKFDDDYEFNYANRMFAQCEKLVSINNFNFNPHYYRPQSLDNKLPTTDYSAMFINCHALESLNLSSLTSLLNSSMAFMFRSCYNLTDLNISNLNTEGVTSFQSTFEKCTKLEAIDLSNFNTSSATNFNGMFRDCSSLKSLDLSTFTWNALIYDVTDQSEDWSNCSGVQNMMRGCTSLTSVIIRHSFPIDKYTRGISLINNQHYNKRRTAFYKFLDSDTKITTHGTLYWPYETAIQVNPDQTTTNVIYPASQQNTDNVNLSKIPYGICSSVLQYDENTSTVTIQSINSYDENATEKYDTLPDNWNIVLLGAPKRNGFAALYDKNISTSTLIKNIPPWIERIKVFSNYNAFKANDTSNLLGLSPDWRLINPPNDDVYVEFVIKESAAPGIDFTLFFEDKPIKAVDFSFLTYPITDIKSMFKGCGGLKHVGSFNTYHSGLPYSYINFNTINSVSAENLFEECRALKGRLQINQNIKINNLTKAFYNCENLNYISINSSECKNWNNAFYNCAELLEVILPLWNLSTTFTNGLDSIFEGCTNLKFKKDITLKGGSYSNILSCNNTFKGCKLLNLEKGSLVLTIDAYINSMQGTFQNCIGLNNASGLYITHKDTIQDLRKVFQNTGFEIINDETCPAFTGEYAIFENVKDIREAFAGCTKLTAFEVKNYHQLSGVKEKSFQIITDKDGETYDVEPSEYQFSLKEKCVQKWLGSSVKVSKLFYDSPLKKILILRDLNIDTDYHTDMFTTNTTFRFIYDGFNVIDKSNYQYILDEIELANQNNIYIGYNVISVPIKAGDKISSYGVYDCPWMQSRHLKFHNAYAYKKANELEFTKFNISEGDLSGGLKCDEVRIDKDSIIDICWRITDNNNKNRIYTEWTYSSHNEEITLSNGEKQNIEYFEGRSSKSSNNEQKWLICPTFGYLWATDASVTYKVTGTSVNGDCYFSQLYTEDFDKFTCRLLDLNHNDENGSDQYSAQSKNYGIYASHNYEGFNIPNKGMHFFNRNFDKHFIEPVHFCTNLKFKDEKSSIWYINQAGSQTDARPYKLFRSIIFGDEEIYYQGDFCLYNSGTYNANNLNSSYPPKVIIPWGCTNRFSNLFKNSRCKEFYINYEKDSKNTTDTKWPIVNQDGSNKNKWSELSFNELFAQCYFAEKISFLLPVITNNQEYYENNKKKKTDLINCYRMFYYACRAYWNDSNKKLQLYYDNSVTPIEINNLLKKYHNNYKDKDEISIKNYGD